MYRAMIERIALATLLVSVIGSSALAQDASSVIANAQTALGDIEAIAYSGSARNVAFQQCGANATHMLCHGMHDPMRPIMYYERLIDLSEPFSRERGEHVNIGPGGSTTVTPGMFAQQVTAAQADVSQPWGGSLELYITPWGFLKGAAENAASVSRRTVDGVPYTVLSWSPDVRAPSGASYVINGYLNEDNLVERVETWLGENIMGDMHIVATYSDWRDWGGFMVPTQIEQTRGGWPYFQVDVTAAQANPADTGALAAAATGPGGGFGGGAMNVTAEELGEGLYLLTTGPGSYDSLLIEFDDHIMMLEAGQSQARAEAYVAESKRLFPDKPIRYVMNTHPHADHTGGLPVLVAEGATIIAHENAREFLQRALNTPRTLLDDALSRNPHPAWIDSVENMKVYTDGDRTVEIYHIWPTPHSNALLVAYLPEEGILYQGDFSLPAPGEEGNDHVKALVPALEKLGITDFERYINTHHSDEPQTRDMLWEAAGR